MTRLWNDPADFADEMIDGFVAANGRYVERVTGGVVRSTRVPDGQVAVVIGGGSGHYPAFGGLVGPGLAHGAAMGNLFASPSTQQVHAVAQAAHAGGGVLLSRPENLGSSRAVGVEFVANGRLHPTLRYNASINLYNQQIDASGIAFGEDAETTTISGRVNLNWQPTPKDFLQIGGFWTGERSAAAVTR